jgi:hypothetical protein
MEIRMVVSKDSFVGRTKLSAEQKAASTHEMAMQIIDAEVAARERKTARLRELRRLHEASHPPAPAKRRGSRPKKA